MSGEGGYAIRYDWARFECPTCGAQPDTRCRSKSGRTTDAHAKRLRYGWQETRARKERPYECRCADPFVGMTPNHGLSAYAIKHGGTDYPRDPGDLCRCTKVSPHGAPKHMRSRSPEWRVLVDNWDELVALVNDEHASGAAPKCYARMKELFAEARAGVSV